MCGVSPLTTLELIPGLRRRQSGSRCHVASFKPHSGGWFCAHGWRPYLVLRARLASVPGRRLTQVPGRWQLGLVLPPVSSVLNPRQRCG